MSEQQSAGAGEPAGAAHRAERGVLAQVRLEGEEAVEAVGLQRRHDLADLAVALAVTSAVTDRPIPPGTIALGEVGQDRLRLPPPPKAGQVQMHADDAQPRAIQGEIGQYRAARLQRGEVEEMMLQHLDMLLHEQGIAMPTEAAGAPSVGALPRNVRTRSGETYSATSGSITQAPT